MKYRQNKSHYHDTAKKIQTPSWRNIAHQMRSILLLYLGLAQPQQHVPFGVLHQLCVNERSTEESSQSRKKARKQELLEKAERDQIGWAIEEKPEIWHMCPFRYRKDCYPQSLQQTDKNVPYFHCQESSDKTQTGTA